METLYSLIVMVDTAYFLQQEHGRNDKTRLESRTEVQIYLNILYINYFAVSIGIPVGIFDSMN